MDISNRTFDTIVAAVVQRIEEPSNAISILKIFVFGFGGLGIFIALVFFISLYSSIEPDGSRGTDRGLAERSTRELSNLIAAARMELRNREWDLETALTRLEMQGIHTPASEPDAGVSVHAARIRESRQTCIIDED